MVINQQNYFSWKQANGLPDDADFIESDELISLVSDNGTDWDAVNDDKHLKEVKERLFSLLNKANAAKPAPRAKTVFKAGKKQTQQVARLKEYTLFPGQKETLKKRKKVVAGGPRKPKKGAEVRAEEPRAATMPKAKKVVAKKAAKPASVKAAKPAVVKAKKAKTPRPKIAGGASELDRLTPAQVVAAGKEFEKKRYEGKVDIDSPATNERRLAPTGRNLKQWSDKPGRYDLVGVDSGGRTDVTVHKKRDANVGKPASKAAGASAAIKEKPAKRKVAAKPASQSAPAAKGKPSSKFTGSKAVGKASTSAAKTSAKKSAAEAPKLSALERLANFFTGNKRKAKPFTPKAIAVKNKPDLKGKNFIQEVDALADQIHKNSATGSFKKVPTYKISRAKAKEQAFKALGTVRSGKVRNVKLK